MRQIILTDNLTETFRVNTIGDVFVLYWAFVEILKAKTLFCRRHPLDICLSNYQQNFLIGHVPYANSFANLIHAFDLCQQALAHAEDIVAATVGSILFLLVLRLFKNR